jgi:AraC-like DNA-binding protein
VDLADAALDGKGGLLAGHALSIAQVAAGVGFYDQAHFTRGFKRDVGTPPGRYVRSATDEPAADSADGAASSHSS